MNSSLPIATMASSPRPTPTPADHDRITHPDYRAKAELELVPKLSNLQVRLRGSDQGYRRCGAGGRGGTVEKTTRTHHYMRRGRQSVVAYVAKPLSSILIVDTTVCPMSPGPSVLWKRAIQTVCQQAVYHHVPTNTTLG